MTPEEIVAFILKNIGDKIPDSEWQKELEKAGIDYGQCKHYIDYLIKEGRLVKIANTTKDSLFHYHLPLNFDFAAEKPISQPIKAAPKRHPISQAWEYINNHKVLAGVTATVIGSMIKWGIPYLWNHWYNIYIGIKQFITHHL